MMVMRAKEFAQKIVPLMKSGVMGEWTLMDAKWKLHARHGPGDLMVKNAKQIAQSCAVLTNCGATEDQTAMDA